MLYRQLWDKAHEAYKTQALATIILSSILIAKKDFQKEVSNYAHIASH